MNEEYLQNQIDKVEWRQQFYEKITAELTTDERFKNYFSQFNEASVKDFIHFYANRKINWYEYGESMSNYRKYKKTKWYKKAIEALEHIQHKKLFNLYCRWFNNEIKLEGIQLVWDAEQLLYQPFSCKFIAPVQAHEVDTYIQFIETLPQEESFQYHHNQKIYPYECWYKCENPIELPGEYPLWFDFFDNQYDTGHLKWLPAPRYQKENDYKKALQNATPALPTEPYVPLEFIHTSDREIFDDFIKKTETPDFFELHLIYRKMEESKRYNSNIDADLQTLQDAKEMVPIHSNQDWRTAIMYASEQYKRKKIIEALPYAFEEYTQRHEQNNFNEWEKEHQPDMATRERIAACVIQGRILLGEPANLNF